MQRGVGQAFPWSVLFSLHRVILRAVRELPAETVHGGSLVCLLVGGRTVSTLAQRQLRTLTVHYFSFHNISRGDMNTLTMRMIEFSYFNIFLIECTSKASTLSALFFLQVLYKCPQLFDSAPDRSLGQGHHKIVCSREDDVSDKNHDAEISNKESDVEV